MGQVSRGSMMFYAFLEVMFCLSGFIVALC